MLNAAEYLPHELRKLLNPLRACQGMTFPTARLKTRRRTDENRMPPDRVFIPFGGPPRGHEVLLNSRGSE